MRAAVVRRDGASAQEVARRIDGEWGKHAITINALSPPFVRTPQVTSLLTDDDFRARLERRIPLGRIAEVGDMVGPILMLASDAGAFVTDHTLLVDGGLTACR
jgi:NAD(P)-dependent dehydrogenase (short-subunit alcohol dehydrogenase family)